MRSGANQLDGDDEPHWLRQKDTDATDLGRKVSIL